MLKNLVTCFKKQGNFSEKGICTYIYIYISKLKSLKWSKLPAWNWGMVYLQRWLVWWWCWPCWKWCRCLGNTAELTCGYSFWNAENMGDNWVFFLWMLILRINSEMFFLDAAIIINPCSKGSKSCPRRPGWNRSLAQHTTIFTMGLWDTLEHVGKYPVITISPQLTRELIL